MTPAFLRTGLQRTLGACVAAVIAVAGLQAGVRGYAFRSAEITRGDMLYALRRSEEWHRLSRMTISTQRAFFLVRLAERRMEEARLAIRRPPREEWWGFAPRAFAAERRFFPVHGSIPGGLILEAERTLAYALVEYPRLEIWQDALVQHIITARELLADTRGHLWDHVDRTADIALREALWRSEDADLYYREHLAGAKERRSVEPLWLDPIAIDASGPNRQILEWETAMRSLPPPVVHEGQQL